jgi:hypothetical protein
MLANELHQLQTVNQSVPVLIASLFVSIFVPDADVDDALPGESPNKVPVPIQDSTCDLPG